MGRSLARAGDLAGSEVRDPARHNPFDALGAHFEVDFDPARHEVRHRQTRPGPGGPVYTLDMPVHYAVGSGSRGRSYLSDRGGFLFQTPVSWYAQKGIWDLSPGFGPQHLAGRPVEGACLYCHANRAHFREGSANAYEEPVFDGLAIGCERCHGPGALHVRSSGALDVVNPRRLSPALRDAVCEQCHLEGEARVLRRGRGLYDFRPGLALEDFWSVFVPAAEAGGARNAVTHVEQMHESRCYQASAGEGRMTCVSCHDPHVKPAPEARVAWYRDRCLVCHRSDAPLARRAVSPTRQRGTDKPDPPAKGSVRGCSLPREARLKERPDDSCVDCHMPRFGTADIVHTAATDHRVLRRPAPPEARQGRPAGTPLVSFHRGQVDREDRELGRDLGLALVQLLKEGTATPDLVGTRAAALLEQAVQDDPDDVPAWEARGLALRLLGRPEEALAAFGRALDREPQREASLMGAALACQDRGRLDEALAYWRRAVAANPSLSLYRRNLTRVLFLANAWAEAGPACREWMTLDPTSADARKVWIACLLHEGKREEARAEFARLEALGPPDLPALRAWFAAQVR
jgi:predicted CXXCH cytochrome family protein